MYAWKHWRVTIDGTATEFELTDEELAALTNYVGVPHPVMLEAMRAWESAGTAEQPRGWMSDEDETHAIEAWVRDPDRPGSLVHTVLFTDRVEGFEGLVYDFAIVTMVPPPSIPIRFQLEPYFPELEKQAAVMPEADTISAFIDNLPEGTGLAKLDYERSMHYVVAEPLDSSSDLEKLLAAHFEIDLKQVEVERRALIGYLDHLNQTSK